MNFLSESKKEKTPSPKMNSLEKKIESLIEGEYCSNVRVGSLANSSIIGNEPYLEKINEQKQKWKDTNVSKSDQKTYLKNALFCRVKHQNEKIHGIVKKMQNSSASAARKLEHDLERNVLHKAFVLEYITKHKLLESSSPSPSPPKSKSVFGTMKNMLFSSKKTGGKTKKGRKTRRSKKTKTRRSKK